MIIDQDKDDKFKGIIFGYDTVAPWCRRKKKKWARKFISAAKNRSRQGTIGLGITR
jgi:hypothetical protein